MPTTSPPTYHLETVAPVTRTRAPVLCLPGLFAGGWVFERLLPLLAARGHVASAFSGRGHPPLAERPDIGRQSVADFAQDAIDAARTLGRPIVIGHSLGGLLALLLAQADVVRAVILLSPAPPRGINVLSPPILARMAAYLPALLFSQPFLPSDAHLDALVLNRVPVELRAAIRARFVPDSGRAARDIALGVPVPAAAIRVPMLVVASEHDRFIPMGTSRRVAAKFGATLHVASGHGHFLLSEPGWEEQAAVILDWIDALPQSAGDVSASGSSENLAAAGGIPAAGTHRSSPE
ncbi:MAG: alpha/beta fold hydrolase [bacterium]